MLFFIYSAIKLYCSKCYKSYVSYSLFVLTFRSEQMRKNNRGVKHNNNNSYYQQPPVYNKVQRNMPPPQQQLDLNSVAKITRKVEVTNETSDKYNRGQDSSRFLAFMIDYCSKLYDLNNNKLVIKIIE